MVTISISNQKGGCGKTITAVNLAWALSNSAKVLLIDLDPQAHATSCLNISNQLTITDLLENFLNKENVNYRNYLVQRSNSLYVIPASLGLTTIEQKIFECNNKLTVLKELLNNFSSLIDYTIIDCPPNLGLLTMNALSASNYTIVPLGMCNFSLNGVDNLNKILKMLKDYTGNSPNPLYLITQFDKRSNFSYLFYERVKNKLSSNLLNTLIRTNITLREAASLGKSVYEYNPQSRGAQDYKELAEEIRKIMGRTTKYWDFSLPDNNFHSVYLVGDFNNWQIEEKYKLTKSKENKWIIHVPLEKGRYRYKFVVDNNWLPDPKNNQYEEDPFGGKNSVILIE